MFIVNAFSSKCRFSFAYLRNVHGFNGKARVSYCSMSIENCKICDLNLGASLTSKVQALALSLASRVQASSLALRVQALASASTALALALVLVLQFWP